MRDLPIICGEKCYPCCSWEQNQHKIYNAHDKAYIALMESDMDKDYEEYERAYEWLNKVEELLTMFDNHIVGNWVYLPYKQYKLAKEIIARY